MTRNDLFETRAKLENVGKYSGEKFRYAYARNIMAVRKAIKDIENSNQPDADILMYRQAQNNLKMEHAEKDENGGLKSDNGSIIMKDMAAFMQAAKDLDELYAATREKIAEKRAALEIYLQEDADIGIHMIKESDVPADMTAADYESIAFMIEGFPCEQ